MSERVHLLGIRHHGPGSAASLIAALDAIEPAEILIELPRDTEPALGFAAAPGMEPPLALLVHDAKDVKRAAFYPFVEYSPEWQALRWASEKGRSVVPIDLAYGASLKLADQAEEAGSDDEAEGDAEGGSEQDADATPLDPLDAIASIAGHSDGESWWDAIVERRRSGPEVFQAVAEIMRAARDAQEDKNASASEREALREAHMRLQIREALKRTEGSIAVVVGAWHVPALEASVPAAKDRALLKGLRPKGIAVTWVPWSDARMSFFSGYRAGVESPGWYRHLWSEYRAQQRDGSRSDDPTAGTARWMARVARALRAEGLPGAPSSSIDAARLATSLASIRQHPVPGLREMQDAALSALCHGEVAALRVVTERLVVGERLGSVDESVPLMPLAVDLQRRQRAVRLKPESLERELSVDLRTESGLARSILLHQMHLIDVPWGRLREARRSRGTFRETWLLKWDPELSLAVADALRHGNTVTEAATGAALARSAELSRVGDVADLVSDCLLAELTAAARIVINRLQAIASATSDLVGLMDAVGPLAEVLRYGTARRVPEEELRALIEAIAIEVNAGLVHAVRDLDDDAGRSAATAVRGFARALDLAERNDLVDGLQAALRRVLGDASATELVAGAAARLLADASALEPDETADALSRALSPTVPAADAASWLEGFLGDEATVLMHDPELLGVIDGWLTALDEDALIPLLPALRRAFTSVGAVERRRLLRSLQSGPRPADRGTAHGPSHRALPPALVAGLPLVSTILGLDGLTSSSEDSTA